MDFVNVIKDFFGMIFNAVKEFILLPVTAVKELVGGVTGSAGGLVSTVIKSTDVPLSNVTATVRELKDPLTAIGSNPALGDIAKMAAFL